MDVRSLNIQRGQRRDNIDLVRGLFVVLTLLAMLALTLFLRKLETWENIAVHNLLERLCQYGYDLGSMRIHGDTSFQCTGGEEPFLHRGRMEILLNLE